MKSLILAFTLVAAVSDGDQIFNLLDEFSKGGSKAYNEVCSSTNGKHLRPVCDYIGLKKEGKVRLFIESAPKTKQEAKPLWEIDALAFGRRPPSEVPAEFRSGFGSRYLDTMHDLAAMGESEALQRFWVLYDSADGGIAEEAQEKLLALFTDSTKVIIDNWKFLRPKREAISFMTTGLSPEKIPAIEKTYAAACPDGKHKVCKEIVDLLRDRAKEAVD